MDYNFTGIATPERAAIDISRLDLELTPSSKLTFFCAASQVNIIISNSTLSPAKAYFHAKHLSQTILNCFGFANGCAYGLELINQHSGDGSIKVHGVQQKELIADNLHVTFGQLLSLSINDVFLQFALRDYTAAIIAEIDCPFLCYRSIETIKNRFHFDSPDSRSNGWDEMHANLQTDKHEVITIKTFSDPVRHGNYNNLRVASLPQRLTFLKSTQSVILKYKDYLKRVANQPK